MELTDNESVPCRLCGAPSSFEFVASDRNRRLGDGRFEYRRCGGRGDTGGCGAITIVELPSDLDCYYAGECYGAGQAELTPALRRREQDKLDLMPELRAPAHLLEIGAGPGHFSRVAKRTGFEVTALEMDPGYCRCLSEEEGLRVVQTSAPEDVLPAMSGIQAVVMWHVIEHLPRPWEVLARSAEILPPGGILALSTPNPDSLQSRLLGRYWLHIDAPRHLQLIPTGALERRLAALGLRLLRLTTCDTVGRLCNLAGWDAMLRRNYAGPPSILRQAGAHAITRGMIPIERRGLNGSTYTAVFMRDGCLDRPPAAMPADGGPTVGARLRKPGPLSLASLSRSCPRRRSRCSTRRSG